MEIDLKFQRALSKIKDLDVSIENIHNLFKIVTTMNFNEVVAAKNVIDLFLEVSVKLDDSAKKVMLSIRKAIVNRCKILHMEMYYSDATNNNRVKNAFGEEGLSIRS